jgi:uncharacterized membrane protein YfcA
MLGSVAAAADLNGTRDALLVLAGVGAGIFNGVAGGGTLISFPALLAMGVPALRANITSTVGIWPGYLGAVRGFRKEIADQRSTVRLLAPLCVVGAIGGSVLLLLTPSKDFSDFAPWLVLFASVLFALQPLISKKLMGRVGSSTNQLLLLGGTFVAALYGGYFGAGMGVVLLAVLGLALPDSIVRTSGMRSILSVMVNGLAAVVFVVHGQLVWAAVGFLALGSAVGGYIGARVAIGIPAPVLRVIVVAIGVATALRLLL